jgi:hypothetical protein
VGGASGGTDLLCRVDQRAGHTTVWFGAPAVATSPAVIIDGGAAGIE